MCQFENGFKLCTCKDISSSEVSNELEKDIYIWELSSIVEMEQAMGRFIAPSDIGQGLEVEWVLLNLNIENCFDFDYQPQENDNLIFYKKPTINDDKYSRYQELSFIYANGQWREYFDLGGDKTTHINEGLIKKHQR